MADEIEGGGPWTLDERADGWPPAWLAGSDRGGGRVPPLGVEVRRYNSADDGEEWVLGLWEIDQSRGSELTAITIHHAVLCWTMQNIPDALDKT